MLYRAGVTTPNQTLNLSGSGDRLFTMSLENLTILSADVAPTLVNTRTHLSTALESTLVVRGLTREHGAALRAVNWCVR